MTKRSLTAAFGFGCLTLLFLAQDTPVAAQRGGGSKGGSSSAGASSGGGARASSGGGARASAPSSSGSSGASAPRSSAPARSSPPPSSAPRSQPSSTPHYQPADSPRYQPPSTPRSQPSDTPRYQPSTRYLPPDNSGRTYDGGRHSDPSSDTSRGTASGRYEAPGSSDSGRADPREQDNGSAPREAGSDGSWNNMTFERRAPRTSVPALSGSDRGPGSQRFGLSQRRAAAAAGQSTSSGEGLVRIPHAEVTREAILERYRSTPVREGQPRGDTNGAGELSRARTETAPLRTRSETAGTAMSGRATSSSTAPARGSVEAARREREAVDHLDRMRASHPERARAIDKAGADVARATDAVTQVTVAAGVGFGTGCWGGWLCQPCNSNCNTSCNNGSWFWYGCYGWPVWCSSGCGTCWPYGWGFSWWGSGWGLSYSSSCYSPWSYGYCYPSYGYGYSSYCSPSPAYYSTVIYQDDQGASYQEAQPVANGEGSVDDHRQVAAPAPMGRGVSQYLSLGDEAFSQGRYSEAVNAYARAVEASPDDGVLYLILSDALFATGDYHYAAFALRRALELDATLLASVVDKHNFYGDPAEFDQQIALAERYLEEHFLDDDARLVLAANYLFANRPAQSSDLLQSAFSKTVRESTSGALLLKRADELRKEHPSAK